VPTNVSSLSLGTKFWLIKRRLHTKKNLTIFYRIISSQQNRVLPIAALSFSTKATWPTYQSSFRTHASVCKMSEFSQTYLNTNTTCFCRRTKIRWTLQKRLESSSKIWTTQNQILT